jgi:hypothetical protein
MGDAGTTAPLIRFRIAMMTLASTSIGIAVAAIWVCLSAGAAFGQVASISLLACDPGGLYSGETATCTVTLNNAAPPGGTEVSLSSNSTLLVPASSLTVPAGATSATFRVTAGSTHSTQSATLTALAAHSVVVNWTASISPNLVNYNVYRGATSGGPYAVIAAVGLATTYTDYNVQAGETYYYVATAVDNTGAESAYSNQASAAVPGSLAQTVTISLCAVPLMGKPIILVPKKCGPSRGGVTKSQEIPQ